MLTANVVLPMEGRPAMMIEVTRLQTRGHLVQLFEPG